MTNTQIETRAVPLPPTADPEYFQGFGVEVVSGFDPADFTDEQFQALERLLYEHDVVLFRGLDLTPEQQYRLTKAFDPTCESYGHGNNQVRGVGEHVLRGGSFRASRRGAPRLVGHQGAAGEEGVVVAPSPPPLPAP